MWWVIKASDGAFFFKPSVLLETTPAQANIYSFLYFMGFLSLQKNISTVCVLLSHIVVKVLVFCSLLPLTPPQRLCGVIDPNCGVCAPAHPYMCPTHGQKE